MRRKQSGVFLVSAAIAVAIAGVLITFWGIRQAQQMRTERAERTGEALKIIGDAVQSFVVKYHDQIEKLLEHGTPLTLTVDGAAVSFQRGQQGNIPHDYYVANLTADNLINVMKIKGIGSKPPAGLGEYKIWIYRNCDVKQGTNCNIDTLTYITESMTKAGTKTPDMDSAVTAARKIGALGGVSRLDGHGKAEFVFLGGATVPMTFPEAGKSALIAVRGGFQSSAMDVFLRRDGSRAMTGDLQMGRHNIVGAGKLTMSDVEVTNASVKGSLDLGDATTQKSADIVNAGNITGNGKLAMSDLEVESGKVKGSLSADAMDVTNKLSVGGALTAKTATADTVTSTSVTADTVKTTKELKSGSGIVVLEKNYRVGGSCSGVGGLGQSSEGIALDSNGRVLSCQRGTWQLASAPQTEAEVPSPIVQIIRDREAMWLSVFRPGGGRLVSSVKGAIACTRMDSNRSEEMRALLINPVPDSEILYADDGEISFNRGGVNIPVACLSRSRHLSGVGGMPDPSTSLTHYYGIRPSEQFQSGSKGFDDIVEKLFRRREQELVVMGIWNYRWANCNGSYRARMEKALACTVTERDWCYSSTGGSQRASVEVDKSDGTPIVSFGNTYGDVTCAFRTKADALAAGFSLCGHEGNNCLAPW